MNFLHWAGPRWRCESLPGPRAPPFREDPRRPRPRARSPPANEVALFDRHLALRHPLLFQGRPRRLVEPSCIDELELLAGPVGLHQIPVASGAGDGIDAGGTHSGKAGEERRLAHVGPAHDGYLWESIFVHISIQIYQLRGCPSIAPVTPPGQPANFAV